MNWRDEQRRDQAAAAEQRRADRESAARIQIEQLRVRGELRNQARSDSAEQDRKARLDKRQLHRRRWRALRDWLVNDAPAVAVISVPMLLAWTAMATYGREVFGPIGVLLPLFSEAAMAWFALAISRAVRQHQPAGWLRVGLLAFALVAAGLNFVHGIAGEHGSWDRGVVMAVVSVGGVAVHQLITAGPRRRRTRMEHEQDRVARLVARRIAAVRRAAIRRASAEVAVDGSVRLVFQPGLVQLTGPRFRQRLTAAILPVVPSPPCPDVTASSDQTSSSVADEVEVWLASQPSSAGSEPPGTAQMPSDAEGDAERRSRGRGAAGTTELNALIARARAAIADGLLPPAPSRRKVQRLLKIRTEVAGQVARALKGDDEGGGVLAPV